MEMTKARAWRELNQLHPVSVVDAIRIAIASAMVLENRLCFCFMVYAPSGNLPASMRRLCLSYAYLELKHRKFSSLPQISKKRLYPSG